MAGDDHNDLDDEFAEFERQAKEAAKKAQEAMTVAKHAHDSDAAKPAAAAPAAAAAPEEEEDESAAFEREAREAAARAQSGMAKSNAAATPSSAAPAAAAPAAAAAGGDAAADAAKPAAATDTGAKDAAVAAAKGKVGEASKRLFGEGGKVASQTILVVGGGIAGLTAAIEAAETGYDVILVEKEPYLGGRVTRLNRYFPKLCHPTCGLEINYQRLKNNPRLKLMTMTEVTGVSGAKGNYKVHPVREVAGNIEDALHHVRIFRDDFHDTGFDFNDGAPFADGEPELSAVFQ
jgi:NADPH-dependent 2,4-dienoyl-CoA reductase/sulfur reductase-like enzyme